MSDNMAVVDIINKQVSEEKTLTKIVRRLVISTLKYNLHLRSKHTPGKHNILSSYTFQISGSFQVSSKSELASNNITSASFDCLIPTAQLLSCVIITKNKNILSQNLEEVTCRSPGSVTLPIFSAVLCNVIAFWCANIYSPSSISSHSHAIKYTHKVLCIAELTEQYFLVKKELWDFHQLAPSKDTRLQITSIILVKLLYALNHIIHYFAEVITYICLSVSFQCFSPSRRSSNEI